MRSPPPARRATPPMRGESTGPAPSPGRALARWSASARPRALPQGAPAWPGTPSCSREATAQALDNFKIQFKNSYFLK
jgi:hypothetical protein